MTEQKSSKLEVHVSESSPEPIDEETRKSAEDQLNEVFSGDTTGFISDKHALWMYGYDPADDDPVIVSQVRWRDGMYWHREDTMRKMTIPEEWKKYLATFKLGQEFDLSPIEGKTVEVTDDVSLYTVFLPACYVQGDSPLPLYVHLNPKRRGVAILGRTPGAAALRRHMAEAIADYLGPPFRILNSRHFGDNMKTGSAKFCHTCRKDLKRVFKCSRCKIARYCSRECQVANWPLHKRVCSGGSKPSA